MPPRKNHNRLKKKKQHQIQSNAIVMPDCVIPQDIMLSILTRLPVKSLLRFKSVCKPWLELFATPNFVKLHHRQFSDDPANQNFMIYSLSKTHRAHTMSLLRIMSDEKSPTILDHPYPEIFFKMDFVGCCNGLICMACPPLGHGIVLWNPAMKLWKPVRLSKVDFGAFELVSLGFGYDEEADDYKVVIIVCLAGRKMKVAAEVYSAKADSWKRVKTGGLQFRVVSTKNDVIVGGDPYWVAKVGKKTSDKGQLVCFDVKKMMFKMVPSSSINLGEEDSPTFMDWKGSLAIILCITTRDDEAVAEGFGSMHVMVLDKDEKVWTIKHISEDIPMRIYGCLQCSKTGKIMGLRFDGKLFVYDPESGGVKVTQVEGADMHSFQIYDYSESLVCFHGMEPLKVINEDEEEEEEEEDEDDLGPSTSGRPAAEDIAGLCMCYLHLHSC